jgi:outer membrane protein
VYHKVPYIRAFANKSSVILQKKFMAKGALIFNVILLVLIAVLFYLHFSSGKTSKQDTPKVASRTTGTADSNSFRIAYFEMDSVTNAFAMIKDVKNELSREEERIGSELAKLQKSFNDQRSKYQQQAAQSGMSQVQSEQASQVLEQMMGSIENRRTELDQKYKNLYMQRMQEVKTKIEDFLKEYNKSKGYSYIFGYEPGFIYYRDTMYNITDDLIRGLNERYKKK